ncbi:NAD dependent epimerase/dehydratase family protein [Mycobacterium xenopi 3993]|nr:NAD dependent epimerase/dehydratase family protein [Mycobacterium xenopi 3993]
MAELILVTGGTGTVGCVVSERLLDAGAQVRVLSRGLRSIGRAPHVVGDVRTGEGLTEAMRDVDTIVHCVDPAHHVVDAALAAAKPHLVFISIVGVDRVPLGYYQRKLADEQLIMGSGLPWTVLRTTQFHDLIAAALRMLAKPPILVVPAGGERSPSMFARWAHAWPNSR